MPQKHYVRAYFQGSLVGSRMENDQGRPLTRREALAIAEKENARTEYRRKMGQRGPHYEFVADSVDNARLNPAALPIRVRIEKITTVADWRNQGVSWQTAVRRAARTAPVFVLRADGSGSLFFLKNGRVRVRTWRKVSIVRPTDSARSLPALVRSL